jgi:thymidylate synthase (FAD)
MEAELQTMSRRLYEERLQAGVAREQARKDLPLSTYTEAYWKINLHNLLHFLELRMDEHAQLEIRSYANVIGYEIVSKWCPLAWEAFLDYQFHSLHLSKQEQAIVQALTGGRIDEAMKLATELGLVSYGTDGLKGNRERVELEEKLKQFNLPIPWFQQPKG